MNIRRAIRSWIPLVFASALGWLACVAAALAAYPDKPIRMIVAFAPGGGSDTASRIIAQRLATELGQQVVVDNRPGASGNIGHDLGAKSTPDGYTLLWCSIGPMAVNVSLYRKLPYQPLRDFDPITLTADSINALVLHPGVPANTVQEFIALAKAQPGNLNYGSSGNGGAGHLAGELFNMMAGVKIVHIPYKGGGPAMLDLVGGQIQAIFATLASALPHIRSGRIRGLAVTRAQRAPMIPELPTIAEAGLPGYEATNWYGIVAPAGTPRPIVARLNREFVKALESPQVRDAFFVSGMLPQSSTPEAFRAYIGSEIEKWGAVIKQIGIHAD
jgi:tripartite-type tricarboxylate transporter receptor subunit TctC